MSKQFIQIGHNIVNVDCIIRVEIDNPFVIMYRRELEDGEAEISSGSRSKRLSWPLASPAAKALEAWLEPQIEVLLPYSEPAQEEEKQFQACTDDLPY